ncbi:hypothetical protein B9479_000296 [Cryptococcus floricola]|uniref:protein-tyrosine-phosphatase n=1 Tax=Cryptococcus floricola TaxID=2591691 RepID=A0A5D3B7R4_9TREE|nr:hypothetical protein B9479_000296 [Cryptococcus floricola]
MAGTQERHKSAPSDASKPDDLAIQDLSAALSSSGGSLRLAAKRLAQSAQRERLQSQKSQGSVSIDDEAIVQDTPEAKEESEKRGIMERAKQRRAAQMAMFANDPEESGYLEQYQDQDEVVEDGEEEGEAVEENGHMQEIIPGLWVGDLVAANDREELAKYGIKNIVSLLRPALTFPDEYSVYKVEIDDSTDTDLLSHLPGCVSWIRTALDGFGMLHGHGEDDDEEEYEGVYSEQEVMKEMESQRPKDMPAEIPTPHPAPILIHCQAGMSRSASLCAAYLISTYALSPDQAIQLIKDKREVIEPSVTFRGQLQVYWEARGKVSLKEKGVRMWYMERSAAQFINGDGSAPSLTNVANYSGSPSSSNPPTPRGYARRKIRCKMCRRLLAVRDHMMPHILDQAPVPSLPPSRPRTPSAGEGTERKRGSFSFGAGMTFTDVQDPSTSPSATARPPPFSERSRRGSQVSEVINPLTGLPGASLSRRGSHGSAASPVGLTFYDRDTGKKDESEPAPPQVPLPKSKSEPSSSVPVPAPVGRGGRPLQSADQLMARLPPHLLALRMAGGGAGASPASTPGSTAPNSPIHPSPPANPAPNASAPASASSNPAQSPSRRRSLLSMTPAGAFADEASPEKAGAKERRGSNDIHGLMGYTPPPILVNPKCSGYFVEPLTWMEPTLASSAVAGKLVCPNEKCGVKIGNYDWAGVQCGCKEWVTPGFCISRSKVDEVW